MRAARGSMNLSKIPVKLSHYLVVTRIVELLGKISEREGGPFKSPENSKLLWITNLDSSCDCK